MVKRIIVVLVVVVFAMNNDQQAMLLAIGSILLVTAHCYVQLLLLTPNICNHAELPIKHLAFTSTQMMMMIVVVGAAAFVCQICSPSCATYRKVYVKEVITMNCSFAFAVD